jgi:hypothetical protein
MPPMPPPPGGAIGASSFFGVSAIIASVVMSRPATEALLLWSVRLCREHRYGLPGTPLAVHSLSQCQPLQTNMVASYSGTPRLCTNSRALMGTGTGGLPRATLCLASTDTITRLP